MYSENLPPHQLAQKCVREVAAKLEAAGIHSALVNAKQLVALAAKHEGSLILLNSLPSDFSQRLAELLRRRLAHEPLQHILGFAAFRRLQLKTAKGVFIPRPETEVAIDEVHEFLQAQPAKAEIQIIDACTGSGTLAAACLDEIPSSVLTAFDLNPLAVELAKENLALASGGKQRFSVFRAQLPAYQGDDLALQEAILQFQKQQQLPTEVDILLSNPPYIPLQATPRDLEVLEYDPPQALFSGEDGLDLPRAVITLAAKSLRSGGLFLMEHADLQGAATRKIATELGEFGQIQTVKDLSGKDRFLKAIKK